MSDDIRATGAGVTVTIPMDRLSPDTVDIFDGMPEDAFGGRIAPAATDDEGEPADTPATKRDRGAKRQLATIVDDLRVVAEKLVTAADTLSRAAAAFAPDPITPYDALATTLAAHESEDVAMLDGMRRVFVFSAGVLVGLVAGVIVCAFAAARGA